MACDGFMSESSNGRLASASPDLEEMAAALAPIVLGASDIVMAAYDAHVPIRRKADQSPVCEADERSEAYILAALADLFPDIPAVSEEAVSAGRIPAVGASFFLVDPLDGTREFEARNGEFTVNIAYIHGGAPVCGAVCAPVMGRLWTGGAGKATAFDIERRDGAFIVTSTATAHARPARSPPETLASRSHLESATQGFLDRMGIAAPRRVGSSVKFCMIASGEADLYPRFGPTMEWDTAAGDAVLRAAGGIVLDEAGAPMSYGKSGSGFHNPNFVAWGDPSTASR